MTMNYGSLHKNSSRDEQGDLQALSIKKELLAVDSC